MKKTLCYEFDDHFATVRLYQTGIDQFTVQYFKQIKTRLNYSEAAMELGSCIMHLLACEGKLDNREKGER